MLRPHNSSPESLLFASSTTCKDYAAQVLGLISSLGSNLTAENGGIVKDVSSFRARALCTLAALAAGLVLAPAARSQTIGVAATVRNDVAQVRGANALPISLGEDVVRNEVVRTGSESSTKLVFTDDTNWRSARFRPSR